MPHAVLTYVFVAPLWDLRLGATRGKGRARPRKTKRERAFWKMHPHSFFLFVSRPPEVLRPPCLYSVGMRARARCGSEPCCVVVEVLVAVASAAAPYQSRSTASTVKNKRKFKWFSLQLQWSWYKRLLSDLSKSQRLPMSKQKKWGKTTLLNNQTALMSRAHTAHNVVGLWRR
jgi:hypothetical protein